MDGSHRSLTRHLLALTVALVFAANAHAATYTVGSGQTYPTLNSLPPLNPGDLVQVNSGTYNEVVRWMRPGTAASPITIRGVGTTRPIVDATGKTVDGAMPNPRAVFQIEASYITIENIEFKNARNGNNGSGIRVTSTSGTTTNFVTIRNCKITNCDMGMQSDSNDNLLIESCEIASNGTSAFSGGSHNLYLNGNKTTVRFCYIHDSLYGQNFKTRGHYTELLYNTISNSQDGEIGFVDSSLTATANSNAVMIGNVIVSKVRLSGWNTGRFIQFGQDLGGAHTGTLYAINNTFVAADGHINYVDVNTSGASAVLLNNVFTGSNSIAVGVGAKSGTNNWLASTATIPSGVTASVLGTSAGLVNPGARDYHLASGSACIDRGTASPTYHDGTGATLTGVPAYEYVNDLKSVARTASGTLDIGAYEYHSATAVAPSITTQPASVTVNVGQTATFTVAASGAATLTYQWQKNGVNISGANATSYTTPATTSSDNGSTFRCVVSNSAGSATSNAATLTVTNQPPAITTQPLSVTVNVGQTAKFTVAASGTAPLTYQWQKNGANISGANATSYTTPATTTSDNGSTFRCVVSNSAGSATSNAATLSVNQPPVITSVAAASPSSALTGEIVTVTVAASDPNANPLTYSWNFGDGISASGATVTHAYGAAGTYTAVATVTDGKGGSVNSSVVITITAAPTSQTVVALNSGGPASGSFTADAKVNGGSTYTTTSAITTVGVPNPAPQAVYQSERYGNFTYTVGGLTAGATYTVRLHFAEIWWNAAGSRVFNVAINGTQVLGNFDIYAVAGGKFRAIVKEFSAVATNGQIAIQYTTVKDNAKSSGIEIVSTTAAAAAIRAVDTAGSISSIDLGSVKAGTSFKLKLDAPDAGKNVKLRYTAPSLRALPAGVRVSGGFLGGKPKVPGTYTFDLTITGKNADATNSYTLTVEP